MNDPICQPPLDRHRPGELASAASPTSPPRTGELVADRHETQHELHQVNNDLERELARRTAELETANRDFESFSASVSHDLRAPLRAIVGYSRMLANRHAAQLDSEAGGLLSVVVSEAERMEGLISDLLAFSCLGRQVLRRRPLDLETMAREVMAELSGREVKREVCLEISGPLRASGDPQLIRQALVNLLSNALKYTRRQPISRIEIGSRSHQEQTLFYIRDNGVGFDMRYAGKLFGIFQRLHGRGEFEGNGIGLALVHRIIQRHGGRVWAQSIPNEGATFIFTLPENPL